MWIHITPDRLTTELTSITGCQTNDKIGRCYLPTKSLDKNLSCVMQKSPNFVGQDRACSIFNDFVGWLFVYRTTNFVYVAMMIAYNGRWIFISVIYFVCYLFSFIRCRKKVTQVLFCDLHSAIVLADIVRSSRQNYRTCVMVHRFCRATQPRPQKSADFVIRLTSPLDY